MAWCNILKQLCPTHETWRKLRGIKQHQHYYHDSMFHILCNRGKKKGVGRVCSLCQDVVVSQRLRRSALLQVHTHPSSLNQFFGSYKTCRWELSLSGLFLTVQSLSTMITKSYIWQPMPRTLTWEGEMDVQFDLHGSNWEARNSSFFILYMESEQLVAQP